MQYENKHVAVLGCGESGIAAAALLIKENAMVTILDSAARESIEHRIAWLDKSRLRLITGEAASRDDTAYDRAVVSPGIDPSTPLVQNFIRRRIEMIGELELAYEACKCPIIGITGTNGKTTTTGLIESMFQGAGRNPIAGGNLGPAFSAIVRESAAADVAVIEISSFQLERIRAFRPDIAVWLNFAPDHLDRYNSLEDYRAAKLRIFENQTANDHAILHADEEIPGVIANTITFSARTERGDFCHRDGWIHFRGERVLEVASTHLSGLHNAENLMASMAVGIAWGLRPSECVSGLQAYRPLAHRNETVGEVQGVRFINDSKATNPSSLAMALESQSTPVILIAGGKEKGFEFTTIHPLIRSKVKAAILIGEMAARMKEEWTPLTACHRAETLAEAVTCAQALAVAGDIVLLSPGTSSYDMFKNFGDRGDQFRALIQALTQ